MNSRIAPFLVRIFGISIVCDTTKETMELVAALKDGGVDASITTMGWAPRRRRLGLCINCSQPAEADTLRCARHRAQHNFKSRARTSAAKRAERAKFLSGLIELHGPTSWTGQQALAAADRESIVLHWTRPGGKAEPA